MHVTAMKSISNQPEVLKNTDVPFVEAAWHLFLQLAAGKMANKTWLKASCDLLQNI